MKKRLLICSAVLLVLFPCLKAGFAQTWTTRVSGTVEELRDVVFLTSTTAVAVAKNGVIVNSTDGGLTWATAFTDPAGKDFRAVFFSGTTVVAVGQDDGGPEVIARSINSGAAWANASSVPGTGQEMKDGLFVNATTAIAVGKGGVVLRSTDGGDIWLNPFTEAGAQELRAVASNGATVVAVGKDNAGAETIIRSINSGAAWAAASSVPGTGEDMRDVVFVNPTTVVAVGKGGRVLRSTDGGDNWFTPFTAAGGQELKAVAFSGATVVFSGALLTSLISPRT